MTQKSIETIIRWLIYTTFFIPLLVIPGSFTYPFVIPKVLLFRALTTLMLFLYGWLLAINWKVYRPKGTPLNYALLAFLLSFTLSTLVGVDFHRSFWDTPARMLGLLTMIHYFIYFYICSQIFRSWNAWKTALNIFLVAGLLVMMIGFFDPYHYLNPSNTRIVSTIGSAVYVGGYCLFLFFISLLLCVKSSSPYYRVLYLSGSGIILMALFLSGTRGAVIGIIFGLAVVMIGFLCTLKNPRIRLLCWVGAIASLILVASVYVTMSDKAVVSRTSALERLFNISSRDFNTSRTMAWKSAIEGWKERPLLGWGPNNFAYVFNAHYNPSALRFGYEETWFDNAHNIILNTLAVQGVVGVVTYLALFATAFYMLYKGYKQGGGDFSLFIIALGLLTAILVFNMTFFDNLVSYLYFMFLLSFVNGITWKKQQNAEVSGFKVPVMPLIFTFLVSIAFIFVLDLRPAVADIRAVNALSRFSSTSIGTIPQLHEALNQNTPHIDDMRMTVSRVIIEALVNHQGLENGKKKQLWEMAEEAVQSNRSTHPNDISSYMLLSQLYEMKAYLTKQLNLIERAKKYLEKALVLSPKRQELIYQLAILEVQLGKTESAVKLFEQAINEDPTVGESYVQLAHAYSVMGMHDKAKDTLERAQQRGIEFNEFEKTNIAEIEESLLLRQLQK